MTAVVPIQKPSPPDIQGLLQSWCNLWGLSDLAPEILVEISSRMTRSLGRCYPDRKLIRVASFVLEESKELFEEVLCHETAHLAAYRLHAKSIRPHGVEWRALVQQAGYPPSIKFTGDCSFPKQPPRPSLRYEHRCPVCQATRFARRAMRRWRCARCVKSGLEGRLEIRTWPVAKEASR